MIKYINNRNTEINLYSDKVRVTKGSLHDTVWDMSFGDVSSKDLSYTITLQAFREDREELNDIRDAFEYDLDNEEEGTLYVNGYQIKCFINMGIPELAQGTIINIPLVVYCGSNRWLKVKETTYTPSTNITGNGVEYVYDYPYEYLSSNDVKTCINDSYKEVDFELSIFGPTNNPEVKIGDLKYKVNVDVPSGSKLVIDSIKRTVYMYDAICQKTNCFEYRARKSATGNDIFDKIKPGENFIVCNNNLTFILKLKESRSAPKWM